MASRRPSARVGILALKNKSTGRCKFIQFTLDYDLAEEIVKKIERVNRHVRDDTLPDKINDDAICDLCSFNEVCLPDVYHDGEIIFDEELEADINQLMELRSSIKPLQDEYDELNEKLKKKLHGVQKAIVGDCVIMGKMVTKKPFTYNGGEYWDMRIKKIKK